MAEVMIGRLIIRKRGQGEHRRDALVRGFMKMNKRTRERERLQLLERSLDVDLPGLCCGGNAASMVVSAGSSHRALLMQ